MTPPNNPQQSRPAQNAQATSNPGLSLPLDVQVAALRQQVDALRNTIAMLQADARGVVTQDSHGRLILPKGDRLEIVIGATRLMIDTNNLGITATGKVQLSAGGTVEASAATVNVSAAMSRFNGTVQCDTLIAANVVGSSYTPGAGNVW